MKAIVIAMCLLIFNIAMSLASGSGLFTTHAYYESEYLTAYEQIPNMSDLTKTDTEPPTMDIFGMFMSTLTFDWVMPYAQAVGIEDESRVFVLGLNTVLAAIIGIAFIEIFIGKSDMLGKS